MKPLKVKRLGCKVSYLHNVGTFCTLINNIHTERKEPWFLRSCFV